MNTKRTLLQLLSLVFVFSTFAQSNKFTFKLGNVYELPRRTEDLSFFGNNQDGIINLGLKKDELNIVRFNPKTLEHTSDKIIELKEVTKNFNSENVIDFGANYYWIHSDWDKSAEKEYLYYDKIDVVNGKLSVNNQKLLEATKIAGTGAEANGFYSMKVTGKYTFNRDAANKKLLVSYRLKPESRREKKTYDNIGLHVFDENMNKLWGAEFTMPYTQAVMDNEDFSIDGFGNAYLLAKVYESDARKEIDKSTGKPGYHFEVLKFTKGSKNIGITQVDLGDKFIKEASLIESPTHEMVVACTYSKKQAGKSKGSDGIFLATIGSDGKLLNYKVGYYNFPISELEKFATPREKRKMEKKDYEAPNLKVRNILVEDDGSVVIVCEEYYKVVDSYTTSNGTIRYTVTYFYENILASKIDGNGTFQWLRKIPKMQKGTQRRGTMSFKFINDASGYYFLYLDNKKNLNLPEDKDPKYHVDGFGGQVMVAKLDKQGVLSKDILFDTRDEDIMVFPAEFSRINGNQFIGRASVKRNFYQPVLITVN